MIFENNENYRSIWKWKWIVGERGLMCYNKKGRKEGRKCLFKDHSTHFNYSFLALAYDGKGPFR